MPSPWTLPDAPGRTGLALCCEPDAGTRRTRVRLAALRVTPAVVTTPTTGKGTTTGHSPTTRASIHAPRPSRSHAAVPFTPTLAPGAALAAFGLTLAYLRYQLHRRRWAAMRMAGCEHVLALWVQHLPTAEALCAGAPAPAPAPAAPVSLFVRLAGRKLVKRGRLVATN